MGLTKILNPHPQMEIHGTISPFPLRKYTSSPLSMTTYARKYPVGHKKILSFCPLSKPREYTPRIHPSSSLPLMTLFSGKCPMGLTKILSPCSQYPSSPTLDALFGKMSNGTQKNSALLSTIQNPWVPPLPSIPSIL